jgi:hypothetical protein
MLRIGTVVLGVEDVHRAAAFWTQALGYVPRDEIEDDWVVLVPPDGQGAGLVLGRSETPVQAHPRVHLDLYAGDAAEVARLVALGAPGHARRAAAGPAPPPPRDRSPRD